jgi:hypothetical protein
MNKMKNYAAPALEICEVEIEKGFALSDGSTVEQISGRAEEESWE